VVSAFAECTLRTRKALTGDRTVQFSTQLSTCVHPNHNLNPTALAVNTDLSLWPLNLTSMFSMNQRTKYLGQRSLSSKVITRARRHTHSRPTALHSHRSGRGKMSPAAVSEICEDPTRWIRKECSSRADRTCDVLARWRGRNTVRTWACWTPVRIAFTCRISSTCLGLICTDAPQPPTLSAWYIIT